MVEDVFGLYNILEVTPEATQQQIKKAYRTLALKYHPDKNHHPDAEKRFKSIAAAYNILSNPDQRKAYDNLKLAQNKETLDLSSLATDNTVILGVILGHIISAGACSLLPLPTLLAYFLAPVVGSLALSTLEAIATHQNNEPMKQIPTFSTTTKLRAGMLASPVIPIALTSGATVALYSAIKNFVSNMSLQNEYSVNSLKMKLEELSREDDWVLIQNSNLSCKNMKEQNMIISLHAECSEDDFIVL